MNPIRPSLTERVRPPDTLAAWEGPLASGATLCVSLMAGLYFSFSVAVMPGLADTDDATVLVTMRSINRAIENLPFAAVFIGSGVGTVAAALVRRRLGHRPAARWTLAAAALYAVTFLATVGVNVPLNDSLAVLDPASGADVIAAARAHFEGPWVASNNVRTVACIAALGCLLKASRCAINSPELR